MLYNKPPFLSYIDGEGEVRGSFSSLLPATTSARPPRSRIRRVIHSIPSLCNPFVRRPIQDADGLFSLIVDVLVGDPLVPQHSPHLQLQTMIGPG